MTNHHTRESIKFLESLIHPKNVEDLQRTKTGLYTLVSHMDIRIIYKIKKCSIVFPRKEMKQHFLKNLVLH